MLFAQVLRTCAFMFSQNYLLIIKHIKRSLQVQVQLLNKNEVYAIEILTTKKRINFLMNKDDKMLV